MATVLFAASGVVLLAWGWAAAQMTLPNAGNAALIVIGGVLVVYAIFKKQLDELIPKWIFDAIVLCFLFALLLMFALFIYGKTDTVTYKEDAVIVLGAGLRGKRPSLSLAKRLNAAIEYHEKNENAVIVVSGGKGRDEIISEAEAMKNYLVENGVKESKIVMEDKSESTSQNFAYSKALLDSMFDKGYSAAYITTDFHAYRAGELAKKTGLELTRKCSELAWYLVPPSYIRELMGIAQMVILKK